MISSGLNRIGFPTELLPVSFVLKRSLGEDLGCVTQDNKGVYPAFLKVNVKQCEIAQDSSLYCIQVPIQVVFVLGYLVEKSSFLR